MNKKGIIGGGISGLAAAYKLHQIHKNAEIHIFEVTNRIGGRVYSQKIETRGKNYCFDFGANLIDFQTKQIESLWRQEIPMQIQTLICEFSNDFLIYENGSLRKGDYYKPRYYLKGGFDKLISLFLQKLHQSNTRIWLNAQVKKIAMLNKNENKLTVSYQDQQNIMRVDQFNEIYLACPVHQFQSMLDQQICLSIPNFKDHVQNTSYTKQISVAFLTTEDMIPFSGMLFLNHPVITFICSHQQKYNINCIVIQTTEEFSHENIDAVDSIITQNVYKAIPNQLKAWVIAENICVKRWETSLIRPNKSYIPNMQALKSMLGNVWIIGDSVFGKSRVSNAIASGFALPNAIA